MATALVTGASDGIGRELARILAREGYDLVVTARREELLNSLAQEIHSRYKRAVETLPADLSAAAGVETVLRRMEAFGDLDVLVNNAGFGDHGLFADADPHRLDAMIAVNVASLTALTRGLLPKMVARGAGQVLNVASVAAFQPGPLMSVYYATKAYVLSLSLGLREELRGTGVSVTALCPGPTKSGFQDVAGIEKSGLMSDSRMPDAREVAEYAYRAMVGRKAIAVHGAGYRFMIFVQRLLPRTFVARMVKGLQEKRR